MYLLLLLLLLLLGLLLLYRVFTVINHASEVCNDGAILLLRFVVQVMLFLMINIVYFYVSLLHSMCAVSSMVVFFSSLILCSLRMLLRYVMNNCVY